MHVTNPPAIMTPRDISLPAMVGETEKEWCVYEHYLITGETSALAYVGHCLLREVYTHPDALRNTEWVRIFTKGTTYTIRIIMTTQSEIEASNYRVKHGREVKAHCNLYGALKSTYNRVQCNETGMVYNSANECARLMNLSQSALSYHLKRRTGFKTVRGFTFSIVS